MKWATTSAKKIALGAAGILALAAFGILFFAPQPAHAATIRWVNRFYLQVDNRYFFDQNTYDNQYEYVEQGATDNCADKIVFTYMQFGNPASASDDTNLEFFYSDRIYNRQSAGTGDVMFRKQLITRNAANDTAGVSGCTESSENINPDSSPNRRVIFYERDSDKKIVHIATQATFTQQGSYPPNGNPSYARYFRDDEVAGQERCIDMIIRHNARVDEGDLIFDTSNDVPGSSLLFAVDDRSGLGRDSESYGPNSGRDAEPTKIGRKECKVDSNAVNGQKSGNKYGLAGYDDNGLDSQILAAGLNSDGRSATGGDYRDDAFIIFIGTENANTKKNPDGTTDTNPTDKPDSEQIGEQTCKGGALGWIICPIVSAIQTTADLLKNAMQALLTVNPLPLDTNQPIYQIWNNIRNFANIGLVIAFFVIIFSQATSIGISNYGIKRMLPNMVAAAIVINLSYFICSFLIDAFNILGVGIYNLVAIVNDGEQGTVDVSNGAGAVLVGLASVGVGASFYTAAVVQLFPLLAAAFIGMFITFLILVARQALLIALVSISSLIALAKFKVIPGLEGLGDKGISIFIALLFMYPAVMLLFAGARLASAILSSVAGDGVLGTSIDVMALVVQVVMGFAAIFLFKWAMIAKGALGRLAGQLNDATKGLTNKAEEFGKSRKFYQRRQLAKEANAAEKKRAAVANYANMASGDGWRARALRRRGAGGLKAQVLGAASFGKAEINRGGQGRIGIAAQTQLDKMEQQEINDAAFVLRRLNIQSPGQLGQIARGGKTTGTDENGRSVVVDAMGNKAMQRAAMKNIISAQDSEQIEELFKAPSTDYRALTNEIAQQYSTAKGAGAHLVKLKPQSYSQADLRAEAVAALSELSYEKLAAQDSRAIETAMMGVLNNQGTPEQRAKLISAAQEALGDINIIKGAKAQVREDLSIMTNRAPLSSRSKPPTP